MSDRPKAAVDTEKMTLTNISGLVSEIVFKPYKISGLKKNKQEAKNAVNKCTKVITMSGYLFRLKYSFERAFKRKNSFFSLESFSTSGAL